MRNPWKYELSKNTALKLRKANDEGSYDDLKEALKSAYKEIINAIPDYFDESDYDSYTEDFDVYSEDDENVDDEWDYELSKFYDLCDDLRIWIPTDRG
jgi:hypothetical protein